MEARLNQILVDLAIAAGTIAREEQHRANAELKADQSYVTNVDLRLSELAMEMLSEVVPRNRIITEEHLEYLDALSDSAVEGSDELLALVDPIDGTRNYFHGIPLYGFSVGILRNRKPWMGVVLFPALGEMVHCDGSELHFVRDLFADEPVRTLLQAPEKELNVNSIVLCSEGFASRYRWDHKRYQLLQSGCATINLIWPVLGRGAGCLFAAYPWDLAGSWPALASIGFSIRGLESGKEMLELDPDDFDPVTHRIREPLVICRPEHYDRLVAASARL